MNENEGVTFKKKYLKFVVRIGGGAIYVLDQVTMYTLKEAITWVYGT